jgi:carboxymethylenebutenolidase
MTIKAESTQTQILKFDTRVDNSSGLGELFDAHILREFADHDVDATMETMVPEPYVYCVPSMTGGFGGEGVRRFYSEHFVNQIPKDAKVTPISRTVGKDQVVDEFIISFTHDKQWDYLLPGISPTGKRVELPHIVVMKFENGKVAHEHVWWDQASLLVQVGLLDPANLPVAGVEQARNLLHAAQAHGKIEALTASLQKVSDKLEKSKPRRR